MDEERKIAYILTGIALIGHFYFSPTYIHTFIVSISIILLFYSIMGSLRARLVLIGFLLFYSYNYFILLNNFFYEISIDVFEMVFFINILITITAIILLLTSINIKETASRFSEQTPLKLTAALFLIIIVWNFIYFFPIGSVLIIVLSTFIAFSLYKKKAIGFILAPLVLIVITTYRINNVFGQVFISGIYKASNFIDVLSYYAFPLLATPLIIFFIFSLKEEELEIVNAIKKKKKILLITTIVLSLFALIFAGCDPNESKNVPITLKWRYETGADAGSVGNFLGYSYPEVVGDIIYMGGQRDYIYAIDRNKGKLKWKFHENSVYFTSTSVADGVVYVGRWTNKYIADKKSYIYAIDAANGKLKWRLELGSPSKMLGSPTAVDGTVYFGSSDHHLYAVDISSGKIKWSFKIIYTMVATPLVSNGVVYTISKNNLYAIDAKSGELKWLYKPGSEHFASYSIVGDMVYVGGWSFYLYAIDAKNGEQKWYFKTQNIVFDSNIVVDGVIYFGSSDNYVYAVNINSDESIWRFKTDDRIIPSPSVINNIVYVECYDQYLYALDSKSGDLMWRYKTKDRIDSNIIVVDDIIYFRCRDGYLYALEINRNSQ